MGKGSGRCDRPALATSAIYALRLDDFQRQTSEWILEFVDELDTTEQVGIKKNPDGAWSIVEHNKLDSEYNYTDVYWYERNEYEQQAAATFSKFDEAEHDAQSKYPLDLLYGTPFPTANAARQAIESLADTATKARMIGNEYVLQTTVPGVKRATIERDIDGWFAIVELDDQLHGICIPASGSNTIYPRRIDVIAAINTALAARL